MELSKAKYIKYNDNDAMAVAKNNVVRWKEGGDDKIKVTVNATSEKSEYVVCSDAFAEAVNNSVLLTDEENRLIGKVLIPETEGEYKVGYLYRGTVDFNGNFDGLDIDGIEINRGVNADTITFGGNKTIKNVYINPELLKDRDSFYGMFSGTTSLQKANTEEWNIGSADISRMFYGSHIETVDLGNADSINDYCFANSYITDITAPNVKNIGERGFFRCSRLKYYDFNNVETIGNTAFSGCTAFSGILFMPNIKSIGANGFTNCNFHTVHIGDKIETIGSNAFNDSNGKLISSLNLVTVAQPNAFDLSAFMYDSTEGGNIASVYVPWQSYDEYVSLTEHGDVFIFKGSFVEYTSVDGKAVYPNTNYLYISPKHIIFAGKIENIEDKIFIGNSNIKTIKFDGATEIGLQAFLRCSELTSASFADVKTVRGYAFQECAQLKSIDLPNATSISTRSFAYCSELNSVNMPKLESIGDSAFIYCSGLASFSSETVKTVGSSAFANSRVKTVSLPNATSIGANAFNWCTSLNSINIPNVTILSNSALNTTALKTVNLPSVTQIGNRAFYACSSLETISIGENCASIGEEVVLGSNKLKWIEIKAVIPPTVNAFTFYHLIESAVIYVPDEAVNAYKTATNWTPYLNRIKPISEKPTI